MTSQTWGAIALAAVVFVLLGVGLVVSITSLVRGNREDVLATGPMAIQQEMAIASPGEVVVMLEVPRTASDFREFKVVVIDQRSGQITALGYSYATAQAAVYGVTTMQVPFGRVNAQAGAYMVRVEGLQAGADYSRYRIILSRPYMGRMATQIVGIVLCGVGMLGCLLWSLWIAGLMKPAQ